MRTNNQTYCPVCNSGNPYIGMEFMCAECKAQVDKEYFAHREEEEKYWSNFGLTEVYDNDNPPF